MEMDSKTAEELLLKYKQGTASQEEKAWVETWYVRFQDKTGAVPVNQVMADQEESWARFEMEFAKKHSFTRKRKRKLYAYAAAAAVAVMVLGIYFFNAPADTNTAITSAKAIVADIAPGKNTATLKTADDKIVQLSDAKTGVIMKDGNVVYSDGSTDAALSAAGGALPIHRESGSASKTMELTTPRGGTYRITLSDGTVATLNADSKLTYPASFANSGERRVKVEGEVYFDVAKNKARPFRVEAGGQMTEVLGTQFNINAYPDEGGVKTTLIEGSVRVVSLAARGRGAEGEEGLVLKPNQQSSITGNGSITVKEVAITSVIDWKNNEFYLDKMEFKLAMRKIARWYNVEIIYSGPIPANLKSGGWIPRSSNLSDVLKAIEATGQVQFKIEGRKLYVNK